MAYNANLHIDGNDYDDNNNRMSLMGTSTSYEILSNGISDGNLLWTYKGSGTFLGFALTQNASTPEPIFTVGYQGTVNDIANLTNQAEEIYLYSVVSSSSPSYSAADPLVIRYKGEIIYSTSSTSPITLAVSGKYLEDDITVILNPPFNPLFAEQDNNTLNIYGAYTASKSGTILTLT